MVPWLLLGVLLALVAGCPGHLEDPARFLDGGGRTADAGAGEGDTDDASVEDASTEDASSDDAPADDADAEPEPDAD